MIPSPYLSYVTGTYNRFPMLKKMLESFRASLGLGIPYEIIIVDGGSKDGTLEYLHQQKDVILIEQGALLGCIQAFNVGCAAARGKYVILGNDDVEFNFESVQRAIAVMDDDPTIGIGCFPQNRYNPQQPEEYSVAKMSAVKDGKRTSVYYGQVCIVPRWLGDKFKWWTDDYISYAGDNTLSCNVLEAGYRVEPIECACINDYVAKDELREINNTQKKGKKYGMTDSQLWIKNWTRNSLLGPVIPDFHSTDQTRVERPQRLVYAPVYEDTVYPHQLQTKVGLRKALAERFLVSEVNYRHNENDLYYDIFMFKPDIVLVQHQNYKDLSYDLMMKLKDENPSTVFVSWNGDYHPEILKNKNYMMVAKLFDIASFASADIQRDYEREGINFRYWQIGWEDYDLLNSFVKPGMFDVIFQANCYSQIRQDLGEVLRAHKEWEVGLFGKWPSHIKADGNTIYDFATSDAMYRSSKIGISDNQFDKSIGYVSNRLFQMLHAGIFTLQQRFLGMEEFLGFEDGKHLVIWDDFGDLQMKIQEWLPKENERRNIAKRGKEFVDTHHSFKNRVDEFIGMVDEFKKV